MSKTKYIYYKITNAEENHYGFQYTTGLNVLKSNFNTDGSCVGGGLYFTKIKYIFRYLSYGIFLREVHLPLDNDFQMISDPHNNKWRANMIILGKKRILSSTSTIKYLIENGADIHIDNDCALKWAVENGYTKIVKLLIEKGANIYARNNCAIKLASAKGHDSIVKNLIKFSNTLTKSEALVLAAAEGHVGIVELLFNDGADLLFNYSEALQLSCVRGHESVVEFLLQNKINPANINNYTLWKLCFDSRINIIKILMHHGLDINTCSGGMIKWASHYGHIKLVELLLENNVDIYDNKALCWAAKQGHIDVVELLSSKGFYTIDDFDKALRWAKQSNRSMIVQLIKNKL